LVTGQWPYVYISTSFIECFCVGARSYIVSVQSVDEDGNLLGRTNRIDREFEVVDISTPFTISTLIPGLRYNVTISSVSNFEKINPVPSPVLVEQTGMSYSSFKYLYLKLYSSMWIKFDPGSIRFGSRNLLRS